MNKPTVQIYRGIPRSGKSTLIHREIVRSVNAGKRPSSSVVFSADDFWINIKTEAYEFDPKRIGEAHAWCFREFLNTLETLGGYSGDYVPDYLFIDNTSIRAYEIAPYIQAANAYGLKHEIVTVLCDPAMATSRNIHGVPAHVIWDMHRRLLTEELPPFWVQKVILNNLQPILNAP